MRVPVLHSAGYNRGLRKRVAPHWRAFWMTAAVIGAVNSGIFLFYVLRPARTLPDGFQNVIVPQWVESACTILNFPGFAVVKFTLISGAKYPPSFDRVLFLVAVGQTLSTIFWAALT